MKVLRACIQHFMYPNLTRASQWTSIWRMYTYWTKIMTQPVLQWMKTQIFTMLVDKVVMKRRSLSTLRLKTGTHMFSAALNLCRKGKITWRVQAVTTRRDFSIFQTGNLMSMRIHLGWMGSRKALKKRQPLLVCLLSYIQFQYAQLLISLANKLSTYDRDICKAFSYKLQTHTTDKAFSLLPRAFETVRPLPNLHGIRTRAAFLSGFKPEHYDCCPNSCCAYTGPHKDLTACPYCKEPRICASGAAQKRFTYIPIIPRLKAFLANPKAATEMAYRSSHKQTRTTVTDIFDGSHYQGLCHSKVKIDGEELDHLYFSDARDVALGLSTDGFAPFKRRKSTAWPLILFNFNLPPDVRFHVDRILALGVIPGPKKPHDIDSFLWPAITELLKLLCGIPSYDALRAEFFLLRAYLIVCFGDIPAVSMLMHMKGHNGVSPCRMCKILGLRVPDTRATTHYVPLDRSRHPVVCADNTAITRYDPKNLPLRTHNELLEQARKVQSATTNAESDRLAKRYGIKGVPMLTYLTSLSFPISFPYDFMHLIWENLMKNLVLLWTGGFKGLNEGNGEYVVVDAIW